MDGYIYDISLQLERTAKAILTSKGPWWLMWSHKNNRNGHNEYKITIDEGLQNF